jgi:hypothetical protein
MAQKRKMPSRNAIAAFWSDKFKNIESDNCFACHWGGQLERCHITARHDGGSDGVDNLHVLCPECHRASECIDGKEYFKWLDYVREKVSRNWWAYHYPKRKYHIKNPSTKLLTWIKENRKDFYAQYYALDEQDLY